MNSFKMTDLATAMNRNKLTTMCLILLVPALAPKSVHGELLLDHGVISPPTSGFAISGSNQSSGGFTLFQPFTIADRAWEIEEIGVFGRESFTSDGSGFLGTLVPDLNGRPDENIPIAGASYSLPEFANPDWVSQPFDAKLTQGRYWLIFSPNSSNSVDHVTLGLTGEGVFSRRGSDGLEFAHGPSAIRIAGRVVPEPSTVGLTVIGLIGAFVTRRRARIESKNNRGNFGGPNSPKIKSECAVWRLALPNGFPIHSFPRKTIGALGICEYAHVDSGP